MPESNRPIRHHPGKPPYTIAAAARDNMLVAVTCYQCRICIHFLASDLVEVSMGNHPAMDPPCRCGKCKTTDTIRVKRDKFTLATLGR